MAAGISSVGTTSVSVSNFTSSAPLPSQGTGQTVVNATVTGAGDNATVYTVPAGKTFYCLGCYLSTRAQGTPCLKSDGTVVIRGAFGAYQGSSFSGGIVFTCAATKLVTIYEVGTANGDCTIWGYLA